MQEKKFVTIFRIAKIIQLCIILMIEAGFLYILMENPSMTGRLYEEPVLYLLCAITWIMLIFGLLCIIFDFFMLRSIAKESHKLKKAAFLDDLTGIPNRHGLDVIFQTYTTPESMANVGCYMVTIDNLKAINQSDSRQAGDRMIQDFCSILESVGDKFGIVGRNGGNDFLVVIDNCKKKKMKSFEGMLEARIADYNREHIDFPIRLRSTYILNSTEGIEAFTQLLTATYNRLHGKQ